MHVSDDKNKDDGDGDDIISKSEEDDEEEEKEITIPARRSLFLPWRAASGDKLYDLIFDAVTRDGIPPMDASRRSPRLNFVRVCIVDCIPPVGRGVQEELGRRSEIGDRLRGERRGIIGGGGGRHDDSVDGAVVHHRPRQRRCLLRPRARAGATPTRRCR